MFIEFQKYEGIGNDFIIINETLVSRAQMTSRVAQQLCDRHRGIGADGILLVHSTSTTHQMTVWNADGSRPEMCGNGIRCVALYLSQHNPSLVGQDFVIQTDAGPHTVSVDMAGPVPEVTVRMRPAHLSADAVGVTRNTDPIRARWVFEGEQALDISLVSMGNPHAVVFTPLSTEKRLRLGPLIEKDPRFKHGVNVEFVQRRSDGGFDVRVWERGAGWTQACGTGACAVVAAACARGITAFGTSTAVELPGGRLHITCLGPEAPMVMRGVARQIYEGRFHTQIWLDTDVRVNTMSDSCHDRR